MGSEINFIDGKITVADTSTAIGIGVRSGQRIEAIDTNSVFAVYRDVLGTESLDDVREKDLLVGGTGGGGGGAGDLVSTNNLSDVDNAATSLSNLGGISETTANARFDDLENMIGVNTLRDSVDAGWTVLDMITGRADEYGDETGVDTGTSTMTYDGTGAFYNNRTSSSYYLMQSNTVNLNTDFNDTLGLYTTTPVGGTDHTTTIVKSGIGTTSMDFNSGARRLQITNDAYFNIGAGQFLISCWVYSTTINTGVKVISANSTLNSEGYVFYINAGVLTLAYYPGPTTMISASGGFSNGTWHHVVVARDSSDDVRMYVDGSQIGSTTNDATALPSTANDSLIGSQAGSSILNGFMQDFKLDNATAGPYTGASYTVPTTLETSGDNELLQSIGFTANAEATNGRVILLIEEIDAVTPNTDITARISRDDGTTFTDVTLSDDGAFNSTTRIYTSNDLDISGQPSGTNMKYNCEVSNSKYLKVHGAWIQWR